MAEEERGKKERIGEKDEGSRRKVNYLFIYKPNMLTLV